MASVEAVFEKMRQGTVQRILAFGSSNTEHFLSGMHWFDCFEIGIKQTIGRMHRCINTGIGGHTSTQLLERYEVDAAFYQPHLVIITIGGNDSAQANVITPAKFSENLLELHRRFSEIGCAVIFQTYYAFNPETIGRPLESFFEYMQIVRDIAAKTGSELMDHLARWEPFRKQNGELYLTMMNDSCHVNDLGNRVMGLDLTRKFGLQLGTDRPEFWTDAREIQKIMDEAVSA